MIYSHCSHFGLLYDMFSSTSRRLYYHVFFLSTFVTNDVKRMIRQPCDSNLINYVIWTVDAKHKTNPTIFAVLMYHWVIFMAVMISDKIQR